MRQTSKFLIKPAVLDWLLEPDDPSVRYFTLTDILDKPDSDKEVLKSKKKIMSGPLVTGILSNQASEGYWEKPERFYTAKYRGTVWQLLILAELGADNTDPRIRNACEFILQNSQEQGSGGFSMRGNQKTGGARSGVIPCLTGNMLWALLRLGYLKHPGARHGINWVTTYQRFDDAEGEAPKGWPYDQYEICWGRHTCHMGVVKALKALSEIPPEERSLEVTDTIRKAAEFMLIHRIFKRSHNLRRMSKPGWSRFGFPLMYQTDVLEILGILTKLGYSDDRMQEALDLLIAKQGSDGKWLLENTHNGHFHADIERIGEPSKWITLNALRVLKGT